MQCSVPNCYKLSKTNDNRNIHSLPKEPNSRNKWLNVLGEINTQCKVYVCSEHFNINDFDGSGQLKSSAVPSLIQKPQLAVHNMVLVLTLINGSESWVWQKENESKANLWHNISSSHLQWKGIARSGWREWVRGAGCGRNLLQSVRDILDLAEDDERVCRMCLSSDTSLYEMSEKGLIHTYEQITGLTVDPADGLPQKLCWECSHRLWSCSRLRDKAVRSQALAEHTLHAAGYLTTDIIKTIDRLSNNLISTLTYKRFDVNYNDLHLHESNINCTEETENNTDIHIHIEETHQTNNIDNIIKEETEFVCYDNYDEAISSSDEILAKHVRKKNKIKKKKEKIDRRKKPAREVLNQDIFDINELTTEEQLLDIKNRQESSNFKNADYKCTECFKGFLDKDAYTCHMTRHTDECGLHVCEICKIHFKTHHSLAGHAAQAHVHKFTCKRCPYVTTRRHAAKLHEKYHNGTRYVCAHCLQVFLKCSTYMSHLRIKHPTQIVCPLCGHSFVSDKGLRLHNKLKHRLDDRPVPADGPKCDQCDIRFISVEALATHQKVSSKHNDQLNVKSTRRQTKEPHDREKEGRKRGKTTQDKQSGPIPCEQCDTQLPDALAYYRHFRRAHPDKNRTNYPSMPSKCMCEVCGRMFQSLALLQDHSWTHTDYKQFKCSQCNKCFQRKYRLIAHRKVHGRQRARHACAVCGKMFSTASNMQRHMFSHTGLKPFKCEMCGKCFKHVSERRTHISYVHLKKPWPKRARCKRRTDGPPGPQRAAQSPSETVQLWRCNEKIDDRQTYVL